MKRLNSLVREEVKGQRAYPVLDIRVRIRLDANENPYRLPPRLRRQFFTALRSVELNRYPEPGSAGIRKAYARHFGVEQDMILVASGSDEAIAILCTAVARPGSAVLIPTPTFPMYRITSRNSGCRVLEVPLDEQGDLNVEAMERRMKAERPAVTFLSYPNNPTGACFSAGRVERLIRVSPGLVVVDEAYHPFSGRTFLPALARHDHLVVLRTLSKIGLAAARVGFLIGAPQLLEELNKVRLPYNMNAFSQVAAAFFLEHEAAFREQTARVLRERDRLVRALRSIPGVRTWPTDANFIFFSCNSRENDVYDTLLREGILVKMFGPPGAATGIRVTVGTRRENGEFLKLLRSVLVPGR
jgi:histidinol-phosphate aminotransferase